MSRKKSSPKSGRYILKADLRVPFAVSAAEGLLLLGLMTLLAYLKVPYLPYIGLGLLAFFLVTAGITLLSSILRYTRAKEAEAIAEQVETDIYRLLRTSVDLPYAVLNSEGKIRVLNTSLQSILGYRSPVCNLPLGEICPGMTMVEIAAAARNHTDGEGTASPTAPSPAETADPNDARRAVVRLPDGRRYRVESYLFRREREHYYFLLFRDVNDYLDLLDKTERDHTVLAYIVLDNLQELTQFVRANYRATANLIEETLAEWVEGMNGMLREYDRDKYLAIFTSEMLEACMKEDFPILDRIMNIRVGDNSFPLSVSMGIADIDGTVFERERAAKTALEMALQRGGNQVALQRRGTDGLSYFGGTHKTLESNTSISSRVSAHLLEKQLGLCDHVLIMSHANPDFDAIGSSVGAYRLCRSMLTRAGREHIPVHIVTDKTCDTYAICRRHLEPLSEYDEVFIDKGMARQTITAHTMLVLTDVSNPVIFESPALIGCIPSVGGVSAIAVIDHHRLVGELPFTPFLHYIEATKSSASEIIAEILQQSDCADALYKEEANLLLSGIMLDTHNFTRSAGSRTFDVTSYLYSRNAHTGVVREFFNESIDDIKIASDFDAHTRIFRDVFAIAHLGPEHEPSPDDRIAASKAADKMLGIRHVEASFALAIIGGGVSISARSKGRINVQLIMEKLDGGGHFDMAGAQITGGVAEAIELLTAAIDEYRTQFPEQCRPAD